MGIRYTFGDYVLDTEDLYALYRCGQHVSLSPKAFDVLVYLIEHRNRIVSREDLIKAVWWQVKSISNSTVDSTISEARHAVGDSGKTQQVIENVPTRGYRFIALIEECSTPVHAEGERTPALQGALMLRIWEPGNLERQGVSLEARGVLPLQPRDTLRIEVEVNRPAYLYLVWIDPQGQPIPLFPWRLGNWEDRPPREQPLMQVSLPKEVEEAWPMAGSASGMETLLLLARETPLPADVSLAARLEILPCCEGRHLYKPLWYENWVPKPQGEHRGIDVSRRVRIADVARARHQVLHRQLAADFSYSLSVSFPSQGDVSGAEKRA